MPDSDKEKRSVERAAGRSVDGVYQPSASTSLFVRDGKSLLSTRRTRKEAQMLKIKIAGSKGQVKVRNVHSGSFSAQSARLPKLV
jgi:ribosomal protein L25 (general stress protein Ctc)